MAREARRMAAILDADVVGRSRLTARLAQHRVQRLGPAVARHGGRLVKLTGDGARAEFPGAAEALGAAIEFQQAMADANRGQSQDTAVVFRLGLHLADANGGRLKEQARGGGIVVSAPLRDAVAGRVKASFAELGSAGLGTVERPVHAYEVGWDPADWPAASAAAAMPVAARGDGKRRSRQAIAIAWAVLLLAGVLYLALAPRPQPARASSRVPVAESLDRLGLERHSEAAFARWQREEEQYDAEPDGPNDESAKADKPQPTDAYDGVYAGTATMRGADGRVVSFKVKVTNGVGSGTQSRLDCGMAPIALRISSLGDVSGMVLIFGSTCLKTELAIRGRVIGGTLQLRLGSQYLELSKPDD